MEWVRAEQQPCPEYGWCMPPEALHAPGPPQLRQPSHLPPQEAELAELASRALRVLLGSDSVLLHAQLRLAVLGRSDPDGSSSSRSKCLLELAVAWLVEQGLVVRQGYGPFASLTVPDVALSRAEALAYSEFPDEGQLAAPHSGGGVGGGPLRGLGGAHRAAPCLNRLRRHSSPRHFGSRMSGVEKAPLRRAKRSVSEDMSSQMVKKLRMQDGSMLVRPASPGGCMAMSP